jgi:hypothetical protein
MYMCAYEQKPGGIGFLFERRTSSSERSNHSICSPIGEKIVRMPLRYAALHPTHLLIFNLNHFAALAESLEVPLIFLHCLS